MLARAKGHRPSELADAAGAAAAEFCVRLGQHWFRRGVGQHLSFAAVVAIHLDALDLRLPRGQIDSADIIDRRGGGQVDRLGHGSVDVPLDGRLHPQVPLRCDLGCGRERCPHLGGQLRIPTYSTSLRDLDR